VSLRRRRDTEQCQLARAFAWRRPMKIPRKHILVVESGDNSVEMLRLYLGYVKYRVTAANTCGECLQLARIERVDLYLLGDGCEDGDAFELCRKIRALDSNTPIVFCSANASHADRRQGMSARECEWRRAKQLRGRNQAAAFITAGIERKHDHDSRDPSS
jgi:CheY-like chemotaxis protein